MAGYVMVVASSAKPGREAEYNHWYDTDHIHEICAIPGIISGRRFDAAWSPYPVPAQHLAIYEVETDDLATLMAEMSSRAASGAMSSCDALDHESVQMWFYAAR